MDKSISRLKTACVKGARKPFLTVGERCDKVFFITRRIAVTCGKGIGMKKIAVVCLAVVLIAVFIPYHTAKTQRFKTGFFDLFDTYSELTLYASSEADATQIAAAAKRELLTCHQLFDIYHEYEGLNNLKTVNDHAGEAPVTVDQRVIDLLVFAKQVFRQTDGQVNVAMGSVLKLWHEKRAEGIANPDHAALPEMAALQAAAQHTDINDLIIDEQARTVFLQDPLMLLDVGAIAKGFATERTSQMLIANGVESALLSIGGNVRSIGTHGDGTPWLVGIQNPDLSQSAEDIAVVALENSSMVTSGSYQRYYIVDGVRYHHIIDPQTLMPSAYAQSVTILTADSGIADALSTALFTVPVEQGKAMLSGFTQADALWVTLDDAIIKTEKFVTVE